MSQADQNPSADVVKLHPRKADRTVAARARRYRRRKRKASRSKSDSVTLTAPKSVTPIVTLPARRTARDAVTLALAALNDPAPVVSCHPTPPRVTILEPAPRARPWLPAVLLLTAFGVGGLALVINGQAGARYGVTPLASITFAGLSLAADALAIVLPATAGALWHARRRLLALTAWAVWAAVALTAVLNSLGFVELHTSDTAAGRQAVVTTATAATAQRQDRIAAAKTAATVATKAREGECAKRGPMCRDREADERTAMAALTVALAVPIPEAATIADADPRVTAAVRLSAWAGLGLRTDDVVNVRLLLLALLPNVAGLLVAFAFGLPGRGCRERA